MTYFYIVCPKASKQFCWSGRSQVLNVTYKHFKQTNKYKETNHLNPHSECHAQ